MGKLKVLLGRDKSLLYDEEVDNQINEEYKNYALTQSDIIDNATYDYINELVSTSEIDNEIDWDADILREVRDSTLAILKKNGYRVWFPQKSN